MKMFWYHNFPHKRVLNDKIIDRVLTRSIILSFDTSLWGKLGYPNTLNRLFILFHIELVSHMHITPFERYKIANFYKWSTEYHWQKQSITFTRCPPYDVSRKITTLCALVLLFTYDYAWFNRYLDLMLITFVIYTNIFLQIK